MRYLACALLLLPGCKMDNPAFGGDTDGASASGASASGSTSDTGSTAPDTKGSDTQSTTDATTDSDTTTDSGATSSSSSGPDTAGTDGTTGAGTGTTGFVACDPFPQHGDIAVQLLENGQPVDVCGDTFSVSGVVSVQGNVWTVSSCVGDPTSCSCPQGELTQLEFVVPAIWPELMPDTIPCARVQVAYDADCNFGSATINQIEGANVIERPHWLANGTGLMPTLGGNPSIKVTPKLDRPCDCEQACCGTQPGEYKLSVEGLSFQGEPYLFPGENKDAVTPGADSYNIANSASFVTPLCDDPPLMSWIAKFNVPG